jgi:AcrR family transcriptional regulator
MGAKLGQNNVKGEQTKRAILAAAAAAFAEGGYRGASLSSIAERAGVTQSGLLHHFRTKEELLSAVLSRSVRSDEERLLELLGRNKGVVESMRALLVESLGNRVDSRLLAVLGAEATTVEHPVQDEMRERFEQLRNRLVGALATDPEHADTDVVAMATALIGLAEGIRLQWVYSPELDVLGAYDRLTRNAGVHD